MTPKKELATAKLEKTNRQNSIIPCCLVPKNDFTNESTLPPEEIISLKLSLGIFPIVQLYTVIPPLGP